MKLLLLASLLLCAQVRAKPDARQLIENVEDVNFRLQDRIDLNIHMLAPEHEVTAGDKQLVIDLLSLGERSFIADVIKDLLEGFRPIVINGNDDIPPLDPFVIDTIGPFEYMMTGIRATAEINDFRVEGLRFYVVDSVTFNVLRLTMGIHVTVPRLTVTGTYDARAAILMISHRAGGDFKVFLNRLELGVDLRMGTNLAGGGHLVLRELDIKIDIHDTFIQITGMTGSTTLNNLISAFIQTTSQQIIQSQLENVSAMLSEQLFDVINDILKDYTLADILG